MKRIIKREAATRLHRAAADRIERIGQTVKVYEDPLSRYKLEGTAVVRRILIDDAEELIYCEVRFTDDGDIRDRWIDRRQFGGA